MRAQLIPLNGGEPIDITKDMTLVGRREDCDLCLDSKSVSKIHCVLVKTDGLLLLRDLGSTNGTRVNGQRVRRAILLPNDELVIAGIPFRVYLGPDEDPRQAYLDQPTQLIEASEVVDLLRRMSPSKSAVDEDLAPPQINALPDAYPDDEPSP
ncbi:MAG: FHA domain-containing protein [Gemmataceae bacterium]|nr:FHA domain-containing protein [Gemmataceae bacterium]MDW8264117.1 FHA domain-containing protein [Gemmataceae bacterium]